MKSEEELQEVMKGFENCKGGSDCCGCPANKVCSPFGNALKQHVRILKWVLGK